MPEKVIIYTSPGCPYCAAAKEELARRGITYQEISTHNNPKAQAEVMRLTNGRGIVPVVVDGNSVQVGYDGAG